MAVRPEDEVLEIGSGPGALTVRLAPRCRRVVAVEIEPRLGHVLQDLTAQHPNLEVLAADILRLDPGALFSGGPYLAAGNIPYYLTGALMRRLLEAQPAPERVAVVVQREVARRWTEPGQASLGSVAISVFGEARMLFSLPAEAFWPAPRVDSALVVIEVFPEPMVPRAATPAFFDLVEALFQGRRKQLGGSVARHLGLSGVEAGIRLSALGIDPTRRPQTLSMEEWLRLFSLVSASG